MCRATLDQLSWEMRSNCRIAACDPSFPRKWIECLFFSFPFFLSFRMLEWNVKSRVNVENLHRYPPRISKALGNNPKQPQIIGKVQDLNMETLVRNPGNSFAPISRGSGRRILENLWKSWRIFGQFLPDRPEYSIVTVFWEPQRMLTHLTGESQESPREASLFVSFLYIQYILYSIWNLISSLENVSDN